jgi:hypothetical protein
LNLLAWRVTAVLRASGDNDLRFLAVDALFLDYSFLEPEQRTLIGIAYMFGIGGRKGNSTFALRIDFSDAAAASWRLGRLVELLPDPEDPGWLDIDRNQCYLGIRLGEVAQGV